ncbi:HK97 family phage prohead protease [Paracoccus versutus]|uniref:Prohead peptidase n=1 Tax=Paracoccus versutus TaxID=34007 RepID=A0A3D9XNB5_PARVE|nr:HK97 family phage prohead protease [Paracoccus versutus]REF69642.1 prohead peptidase [Paracoccus versutus]SFY21053.1 hypothetical protein SAMN04244548_03099 [Paracoccus pantotrophus]
MNRIEQKSGLDLKFAGAALAIDVKGDDGVIEGYASKFSEIDRGNDMVMPGAYRASIAAKRPGAVKMLWQHDPSQPIGFWETIQEDDTGLRVKGRLLTEVQRGREALVMLKAGVLDGLSIGYRTEDYGYVTEGGRTIRQLKKLDLWEISLVTFPMLPSARVAAKGDESDPKFVEQALRDAGLSRTAAKRIVAQGVKGAPRDAGDEGDLSAGLSAVFQSVIKG